MIQMMTLVIDVGGGGQHYYLRHTKMTFALLMALILWLSLWPLFHIAFVTFPFLPISSSSSSSSTFMSLMLPQVLQEAQVIAIIDEQPASTRKKQMSPQLILVPHQNGGNDEQDVAGDFVFNGNNNKVNVRKKRLSSSTKSTKTTAIITSSSSSSKLLLPRAFANNSLFLQTIRLTTTNYQKQRQQPHHHHQQQEQQQFVTDNDDLHVDLFGFSGDATRPIGEGWDPHCSNVPNRFNETLWGAKELKGKIDLFCQLEYYDTTKNQNMTTTTMSSPRHDRRRRRRRPTLKSKLIPMLFVPMKSVDDSQTIGSVQWRCNVTEIMTKSQLIKYIDDIDHGFEYNDFDDNIATGADAAGRSRTATTTNATITVHIWIRYKRHYNTNNNRRKQKVGTTTKLATFPIPLDTGSLGVGSPRIRGGSAKSYFHQSPVAAGLCVSIYGSKPLPYVREFVQHHLNVGFGSIFIGVKGPENGAELHQTRNLLQTYIDQGVVALSHYDSPFTCDQVHGSQVDQMQFYQPCLYYHKGLTKYSATWDIDEFWIPPPFLYMDGHHSYSFYQMGAGEIVMTPESTNSRDTAAHSAPSAPSIIKNASSWSTFPRIVRSDPIWQQSQYAKSISIADTLDAIDRYYVANGCATSFCYHIFPSRVALLRDGAMDIMNRTKRIGQDFEHRTVFYDNTWQKSVVNTNIAFMSGIHVAGSCHFVEDSRRDNADSLLRRHTNFVSYSNKPACDPRRFEHEAYGSIHHFFDLLLNRWDDAIPNANDTQKDEYVSLYSTTVEQQLERSTAEKA